MSGELDRLGAMQENKWRRRPIDVRRQFHENLTALERPGQHLTVPNYKLYCRRKQAGACQCINVLWVSLWAFWTCLRQIAYGQTPVKSLLHGSTIITSLMFPPYDYCPKARLVLSGPTGLRCFFSEKEVLFKTAAHCLHKFTSSN